MEYKKNGKGKSEGERVCDDLTSVFICVYRNRVTVWPLSPVQAVRQSLERLSHQVCFTPAAFSSINTKAFFGTTSVLFLCFHPAVSYRDVETIHHSGGGGARCGRWKAWRFTEKAGALSASLMGNLEALVKKIIVNLRNVILGMRTDFLHCLVIVA